MVIYKKDFDVVLHLEAKWPSKQKILIADTFLAEPGLVQRALAEQSPESLLLASFLCRG